MQFLIVQGLTPQFAQLLRPPYTQTGTLFPTVKKCLSVCLTVRVLQKNLMCSNRIMTSTCSALF